MRRIFPIALSLVLLAPASCTKTNAAAPGPTPAPAPTQATSAPEDKTGVVHIGTKADQYGTGFYDLKKGVWSGFDVDISRYVSAVVYNGRTPEFSIVTSATRDDLLLKDSSLRFNAATESMLPPRTSRLIFAGPYMRTPQGFLINRRKHPNIKTLQDVIKSGPVCVADGSISGRTAKIDNVRTISASTYSDCLDAVRSGDRIAMTTDVIILEGLRRQAGYRDLTVLKSAQGNYVHVGDDYYKWGLAFRPADEEDCRKAVAAIKKALLEGAWDNWFLNRFGDIPHDNFKPSSTDLDNDACKLDAPSGSQVSGGLG